mmetsp:Transcript_47405/g.115438  ORF Transcript_47405/g.115438 Transcript_47405/m.115438 type:complete len:237 (-) Transcript_47405:289-999(-)
MRHHDDWLASDRVRLVLRKHSAIPSLRPRLAFPADRKVHLERRVLLGEGVHHVLVSRAALCALYAEGSLRCVLDRITPLRHPLDHLVLKSLRVEPPPLPLAHSEDVRLQPDGFAKHHHSSGVARDQVPVEREEAKRVRRCLQERRLISSVPLDLRFDLERPLGHHAAWHRHVHAFPLGRPPHQHHGAARRLDRDVLLGRMRYNVPLQHLLLLYLDDCEPLVPLLLLRIRPCRVQVP